MRLVLVLTLLMACDRGTVFVGTPGPSDADTDADTDTDTDTDADADTDAAEEPCFETDIVPIFERSCGTGDDSCHSPVAYGPIAANSCEGWLSLTNTPLGGDDCPPLPLYDRLVLLHGWSCLVNGAEESSFAPLRWNYVTPFDPDTSVLYQKIAPDGVLCAGENQESTQRMPLDAPLSEAEIALVRTWIEEGAKAGAACDTPTTPPTVQNAAPVVVIDHPGEGEVRLISNGPFPFIGRATDAEDGDLAASLAWSSSLEGLIGVGASFDHVLQPTGIHVVTATVTDADGASGSASITLEMVP
ncbi:MAG: hypothetical protein H0V89_05050 [Deltaproteobacteria bacterium]|nr:hypothetical protein [Deltaproteobacteria bacterium]